MNIGGLTAGVMTRLQDSGHNLLAYEDYEDHVRAGILEYSRHRPYHRKGTLTLVSGMADYTAPTDFIRAISVEWGDRTFNDQPWDGRSVDGVPAILLIAGNLRLSPIPTAVMIGSKGSSFDYLYQARHSVTATSSTIPEDDEILVRLAALRSACLEIAAASDQGEAFVERYSRLAKRYGERFIDLIGAGRPVLLRS